MLRVLLYLVPIVLAVYALVDCVQTPAEHVRGIPKAAWILLILLLTPVGPIAWLVAGRARGGSGIRRPPWSTGPAPAGPARVLAPDDDPDFLAQLGRERSAPSDDALLEEWEEDLRRREGDLRERDDGARDTSPDDPDERPPTS